MERLFLIGQYQLHLNYIGYTYVIHHTYHTLGSLIPNVWYVLYSLYGSLFTPHVVLPTWRNHSTPEEPAPWASFSSMHDMVYWSRQYVTAIFLRFSEYLIFWWLSTRWTWLISVKIYIIRLSQTTRRCLRHSISRTWYLSLSAPRMEIM